MICNPSVALRSVFPRAAFGVLAALLAAGSAGNSQAYRTAVGYNQLLAEVETVPDGSGVKVALIEADASSETNINLFLPDESNSQLSSVTFTNGSSSLSGLGVSTHATDMARNLVGNVLSLAPGVTDVTVYEADNYLVSVLRLSPTTAGPPFAPTYKVANHSYVGSFEGTGSEDLEVLRRYDYLVDTWDVLSAVGISNASGQSHDRLLSHTYNSLTVGNTNGAHSRGLTTFASYGPGRIKPDIVVAQPSTSSATAAVSSAMAMLTQSATDTANFPNADADAARSETMRAILLAGATKDEFAGWENAAVTQPLDLIYGAGELNVYNSFMIQQAGQWEGSVTQGSSNSGAYGWDYSEISEESSLFYELEVPRFYSGNELSVALTWNAEVTDSTAANQFVPQQHVADFDLFVYDSTGSPLGVLLASSESAVDNTEHVWLTDLSEGDYTLEVRYNYEDDIAYDGATRDFGIAWRLELEAPYRSTGDYNGDGVVDAGDYAIWRTNLGSEENLAADGDLNGIVDEGDYLLWRAEFGKVLNPEATQTASLPTPEPSAAAMAAGLLALSGRRRR